jgi:hypothetical protein
MTDNHNLELPPMDEVELRPTSEAVDDPVEQAKLHSDYGDTIEFMESVLKTSDEVDHYPTNWPHSPSSQERIPRIVTYVFESDGEIRARVGAAIARIIDDGPPDCEETVWNQIRKAYPASDLPKQHFVWFLEDAVDEYEHRFPTEGDNE